MEKFYSLIYRLRSIKRWATSITIRKESVAEHSYSVAVIAYLLAVLDKELNSSLIDADAVAVCALFHDSFECYTSHIISPVKNKDDSILKSINDLKTHYTSRLLSSAPSNQREAIGLVIEPTDKKCMEIISMADTIDAYIWTMMQVKNGNPDFIKKLQLYEKQIDKLKKTEKIVDFFLNDFCDFDNFEIDY